MHTRKDMENMSNEELNIIAQQKNKRGIATKEARKAQEMIWNRRFYITSNLNDWVRLDDMQNNFRSYWED